MTGGDSCRKECGFTTCPVRVTLDGDGGGEDMTRQVIQKVESKHQTGERCAVSGEVITNNCRVIFLVDIFCQNSLRDCAK